MKLKNTLGLIEEKAAENKDMIENYLKEHNNVKIELEELKRKVDGIENIIEKKSDNKSSENKDDAITSDF